LARTIEANNNREVGGARVLCRNQQHQQQNEDGAHLHRGIEAQIAVPLQFSSTPHEHAADACGLQRGEQPQAGDNAHSLRDDGGEQSHEDDHDGDAVPDQTRIFGREMIVGRAERGENQSGEHHEVEPALAVIGESPGAWFEQEHQAAESDQREGEVRDCISEVRDTEPGSVVGEVVVGEGLRDRREE